MDGVVKQERVSSWPDLQNDRACEWCSSPDYMKTMLPMYVDKPLDEWYSELLDLCCCFDCVQEYHRLAEELIEESPKYKKIFQDLDIDRLTQTITKALENPVERKVFDPPLQDVATKLQVPLTEILRYPYFLHHEQLAAWFAKGLISLNQCECPLKLEEKLAGAYLLLVHPDQKVRGWAVRSVRGLGLINPDDYDLLTDVIRWMIGVVQFNLFDYSDIVEPENKDVALPFDHIPSHLFIPLTRKDYWLSLFILVRQMDVSTVQTCFMTSDDLGHIVFLETIVSPMESQEQDEGAFWPMLKCFAVLLERLGGRIWQMPSFNNTPADLFRIITENRTYRDSIQQWQDEGESSFSQEVLHDTDRTRLLSCSSGRFYKTSIAWFHYFVQSVLDFDSGEQCVSKVVRYLHDVADGCLLQTSFRHEVVSSLLTIILELFNKGMNSLLVPTVRLWATYFVEEAINGSVDKKMIVDLQRRIPLLLRDCHRLGHKNALKYRDIFMLPGPKHLSPDDKQQIISLLVQNVETQQMRSPLQPGFQNASSKKPQMLMQSESKTDIKHLLQADMWLKELSPQKAENKQKANTCTSVKQETIIASNWNTDAAKSVMEKATAQGPKDEKQSPSIAVHHHGSLADQSIGAAKSAASSARDSEPRKRKIDPTVRYWGEPGPSTRVSEDEDDEEERWVIVKRTKKRHRPFGDVTISKRSLAMKGSPIRACVKIDDCRKQGIKDNKLSSLQSRNLATTSTSTEAKTTETKLKNVAAKGPIKPKWRYTARKSAGRIKKHLPRRQKRGATWKDPIVLSDEDDSAVEMSQQKKPFPKEEKDSDNYFSDNNNESDDVALLEMMDTIDSQKETSKIDSLGEKYQSSISQQKATSSVPAGTSTHDISFPEVKIENVEMESDSALSGEIAVNAASVKTSMHDSFVPSVKTEKVEAELATVLYPEVRDIEAEVYDDNESSSSKEDIEKHESVDMRQDAQINHEPMEPREGDTSLSSISNQLQNNAIVDDEMNFWNGYCGYSELILNSQENALASIEDDLEDLYSTQTQDVEDKNTISSNRDDEDRAHDDSVGKSYNDRAEMAVKPVSFHDDTTPADTAMISGRAGSSLAAKPAITTPRKALREEEFFHEIVRWNVLQLGDPERNERPASLPRKLTAVPVPEKTGFESMDQYYDTFKPLLFLEIWEQVTNSWQNKDVNRKRVLMDVLDGSASNNLSIIPCSGFISEHQQKKALFPLESDLVLVRLTVGNVRDGGHMQPGYQYGQAVFGIVEKADVKTIRSPRRVSLGSSGEDDVSDTTKFHLTLNIKTNAKFRPVRNSCLQVEFVTSLLTALRQWCGMMHLNKSLLACDILKPRKADYFCSNNYERSSLVSKEYNESQEKVISTAANAVHMPFPIPRICLVQGPPGTGKSYTIVGLVKEILNRPQEIPTQTATGPSNGHLANKVRILLCAPSNAAIDELIGQIAQARIRLDKSQDNKENRRSHQQRVVKTAVAKNCGDVSLIRVGRKSHIHPAVMNFALDSITKQVKDKAYSSAMADDLNSIKDKIKTCDARGKELDQLIWQFENSPHPDNHVKLKQLQDEKAAVKSSKVVLHMKYRTEKAKEANSRRQEARIRREILDSADIICTTLSGAGSASLRHDLQLAGRRICPFTCVIVDEACQSTELDLLIPLGFKASKLVLVGDPEQLQPTVLSVKAKENLFGRSMFERLYRFFRHHEMGKPVLMLEEQYRMHPEIASFPSQHVYSSRLKSHSSLESRPFELTKHYALFDVYRGREICQERGALWNLFEVDMIADLCSELTKVLRPESVGIITPYRKQKGEIQRRLQDRGESRGDTIIEVNTVDGFQGREKDVIILSCVRAKNYRQLGGSIGFVGDRQRMNVALTRARHALYVFGHMETLKEGSKEWSALIEDAQKRHCLFPVATAKEVQSVLSVGDVQSPANDPRLSHNVASARRREGTSTNTRDHHLPHGNISVDIPLSEERVRSKVTPSPALKLNKGNDVPIPKNQRLHSTAVQRRENANETSNREKAISTNTADRVPSHGDFLINRQAAESTKTAPYSKHVHDEEKHGKEGTRQTDRHRARGGTSRHGHHHKDTEMRHDDRHRGNQHGSKRPLDEYGAGALKERHIYDVSNREHHRSGHTKHDRAQEYRHSGRPIVPGQSNKRARFPDDRIRSHSASTALYNGTVSNREGMDNNSTFQVDAREGASPADSDRSSTMTSSMNSNSFSNGGDMDEDNSQMGTQDYLLASVIEHHPSIDPSYFAQLHQQEKHQSGRSPSETSANNSPTGSPKSPTETAVISAPHRGPSAVASQSTSKHPLERSWPSGSRSTHQKALSHGVPQQSERLPSETSANNSPTVSPKPPTETAVISAPHRGPSAVVSQSVSKHPLARSWSSVSRSTHQETPSHGVPQQSERLPSETSANNSPTGSPKSPTETAVISAPHRGPSAVVSQSVSKHPLARSWSSVSRSTHQETPSHEVPHQSERLRNESYPTVASTGSPMSPTETVVISAPPRGSSTVVSQSVSMHPLARSWSSVSRSTHQETPSHEVPHQSERLRNESYPTVASTGSPMSPNETVVTSVPPRRPFTVTPQSTSRPPSVSHFTHQTTPSHGVLEVSAGSSLSSQPSASRLSDSLSTARPSNQQLSSVGNHSLGHRSGTVQGELDPTAQRAANSVRQRHPPVRGPQIIPATSDVLHGGSHRRQAHGNADVSSLRARGASGGEATEQRRRERSAPSRISNERRRMFETFRGRTKWK